MSAAAAATLPSVGGRLACVGDRCHRRRHHARLMTVAASDSGTGSLEAEPVVVREQSLERWLSSPQDFIAFGPRVSLGFLASLPELASRLQAQAERLSVLSQDPRPLGEKGQALLMEASADLAELVERGAVLEADLLLNVGQLVPEGVREALPGEIRQALEGGRDRVYSASFTVVEVDSPMVPATIAANQTVAEMVGLRSAVGDLREALAALANNGSVAEDGVLRLNVREARTSLNRRLAQLSPATFNTMEGGVQVAIEEATDLLAEVDALTL